MAPTHSQVRFLLVFIVLALLAITSLYCSSRHSKWRQRLRHLCLYARTHMLALVPRRARERIAHHGMQVFALAILLSGLRVRF